MTVRNQFDQLRTALNERHLERYDEVEIAITALLTKYHVVLIGPPGTAKSMLAEDLTRVFVGTRLFKYLLTKFTTPEEIFGPWNLKRLEEGVYERITNGKLPEAHIAFEDEIFKANAAILNAHLTLMNERMFDNGIHRVPAPLMTLFAASNEMPEGEELWALFDRFQFRKVVDYIHEPSNFLRMLHGAPTELPEIEFADLMEAQAEVAAMKIPDGIYETLHDIREDMKLEGIIASDRRFKQSLDALRAMAWLDGRESVTDDDFRILQHMLWTQPGEAKKVSRVVLGHTNPLELKADEIIDAADAIAGDLQAALLDAKQKKVDPKSALTKQGIDWFAKCRNLSDELKALEDKAIRTGKNTNRIKQARDRVFRVAGDVGRHTIGIEDIGGLKG